MTDETLAFGLNYDRDYFVAFAKNFREFFWPFSVFLVHPFTIFVLIRKSPMSIDCKTAYVVLMCFDFYNCALYQMYPMAPIPVFICTGSLCHGKAEGTTMLTGLSFWTISLCVPYLFIMLRMHQKMLFQGSPFKISARKQALVLLILTSFLVANVFGFHYWAIEPQNKKEVIKMKEVAWAERFSNNFLVLGKKEGDVGTFVYELILLIVSIFVNFSFYILITYHAVYKIGRQLDKGSAKTRKGQLRFVYSLTIQACCSAVLFILPLLFLFSGLIILRVRWLFPGWLVALFRVVMLLAYTSCSIAHSIVYLSKNPWFIQQSRRVLGISRSTSTIAAVASVFKLIGDPPMIWRTNEPKNLKVQSLRNLKLESDHS